ncbi:hypothetical protein TWF730_007145 [Orbilia blumenaviensis]|uniref:Zn(2)-C6 fungal-type domain-containing protein n=1 Tax=Orbilia blumenaviensis TaxID=1796055 RepID=A0AAV9VML1_9PEZI
MEKTSRIQKKRKVRKGTQSCWECKRRKIRCTFAAPRNSTCDGCKSRQTKCIGQEYENEAMEAAAPSSQSVEGDDILHKISRLDNVRQNSELESTAKPESKRRKSGSSKIEANPEVNEAGIEGISRALISEWPSKSEFDALLTAPVGVSVLFHGLICRPYAGLFSKDLPSPREVLLSPHEGAHPVIVARKLLLLATFLQGIPMSTTSDFAAMGLDCRTIMSRVFNAAARLITNNDELITTLDGIECVMIESMYLNNAGNLRAAWLKNRRAMGLAQMIRLDSNEISWPIMRLDKATENRIDPKYMWFRLVVSDRYLSMMLGLPQGTAENSFACPSILNECTALERMERLEAVAVGLILQRNSTTKKRTDLASTYEIDTMIREAAALMPSQWWLPSLNLSAISRNGVEALEESVRLTAQFAHYHTLVQLHLPYILLQSTPELNYDYNKMVAANSSREVLQRFVAFCTSSPAPAYCRGIDFVAFIASTTLCLAHMEAVRPSGTNLTYTTFHSIKHQRLSDRGLLERVLEIMEEMASTNNDAVSRQISRILRPLLAIENNSRKGGHYNISICTNSASLESRYVNTVGEDVHGVYIQIPYLGTVQIEHRAEVSGQSDTDAQMDIIIAGSSFETSQPARAIHHSVARDRSVTPHLTPNDHITNQAVDADFEAMKVLQESSEIASQNDILTGFGLADSGDRYSLFPSLEVNLNDWTLQGVDIALFNSLIPGDFNID